MKPDERYVTFIISDDAHWEVLHVLQTCSLLRAGTRDEQHVGFLKELVVSITPCHKFLKEAFSLFLRSVQWRKIMQLKHDTLKLINDVVLLHINRRVQYCTI